MNEPEFRSLVECVQHSHGFMDCVHNLQTGVDRVCHHNSYLIAKLLDHLGRPLVWVNGLYQCANPRDTIHHSWLATAPEDPALIFEFDPHQLQRGADYESDLMPGPGTDGSLICANAAVIVDPDRVQVPEEMREEGWIVRSADVLSRYRADSIYRPDIDCDVLDDVAADAIGVFEHSRELRSAEVDG
jgi:hypothetical protein